MEFTTIVLFVIVIFLAWCLYTIAAGLGNIVSTNINLTYEIGKLAIYTESVNDSLADIETAIRRSNDSLDGIRTDLGTSEYYLSNIESELQASNKYLFSIEQSADEIVRNQD